MAAAEITHGHCDSEPNRTGPDLGFYEAPPEGFEPSHTV